MQIKLTSLAGRNPFDGMCPSPCLPETDQSVVRLLARLNCKVQVCSKRARSVVLLSCAAPKLEGKNSPSRSLYTRAHPARFRSFRANMFSRGIEIGLSATIDGFLTRSGPSGLMPDFLSRRVNLSRCGSGPLYLPHLPL